VVAVLLMGVASWVFFATAKPLLSRLARPATEVLDKLV
jgi:hypothetical protein